MKIHLMRIANAAMVLTCVGSGSCVENALAYLRKGPYYTIESPRVLWRQVGLS